MITILLRGLEKAPNDHGVIMWKTNLRRAVLERLGGLEMEECYSVATLLDPRYFIYYIEQVSKRDCGINLFHVILFN